MKQKKNEITLLANKIVLTDSLLFKVPFESLIRKNRAVCDVRKILFLPFNVKDSFRNTCNSFP